MFRVSRQCNLTIRLHLSTSGLEKYLGLKKKFLDFRFSVRKPKSQKYDPKAVVCLNTVSY